MKSPTHNRATSPRRFRLFSIDDVMKTAPAEAVALEEIPQDEADNYLLVRLPRNTELNELIIALESAVAALAGLKARTPLVDGPSAASVTDASALSSTKGPFAERNRQRLEALRRQVFENGRWLTARDLSTLRGISASNPSAQPNRWKQTGKIFAVTEGGKDWYPAWALDEGGQPLPVMKQILEVFGEGKTPWALAFWFHAPNGWLGGERPMELIGRRPADVLNAAKAEAEGPVSG